MGGAESRSVLERASWVSMSFLRSVQVSMSWLTRQMMRRLSSAGVGRGTSRGVSGSGSSEAGIAGWEGWVSGVRRGVGRGRREWIGGRLPEGISGVVEMEGVGRLVEAEIEEVGE